MAVCPGRRHSGPEMPDCSPSAPAHRGGRRLHRLHQAAALPGLQSALIGRSLTTARRRGKTIWLQTSGTAHHRGAVTVSDRPADGPVPPSRASARKRTYTGHGTNDGTSAERRIATEQPSMSNEERRPSRKPARKTRDVHESGTGFRSRSTTRQRWRCSPRSCAAFLNPGHRAKAPAMNGTRRNYRVDWRRQ